jgi:hypothetical protein
VCDLIIATTRYEHCKMYALRCLAYKEKEEEEKKRRRRERRRGV